MYNKNLLMHEDLIVQYRRVRKLNCSIQKSHLQKNKNTSEPESLQCQCNYRWRIQVLQKIHRSTGIETQQMNYLSVSLLSSSGAARMRPKRPWPFPVRNKLAKIFTGALYQFSTRRKTSVTDDVIDWPLPNKNLGCAKLSRFCLNC